MGKPRPGHSTCVGIEVGKHILCLRGMVPSTLPEGVGWSRAAGGGGRTGVCCGVMRGGWKQKHLHKVSQERMMLTSPSGKRAKGTETWKFTNSKRKRKAQ